MPDENTKPTANPTNMFCYSPGTSASMTAAPAAFQRKLLVFAGACKLQRESEPGKVGGGLLLGKEGQIMNQQIEHQQKHFNPHSFDPHPNICEALEESKPSHPTSGVLTKSSSISSMGTDSWLDMSAEICVESNGQSSWLAQRLREKFA